MQKVGLSLQLLHKETKTNYYVSFQQYTFPEQESQVPADKITQSNNSHAQFYFHKSSSFFRQKKKKKKKERKRKINTTHNAPFQITVLVRFSSVWFSLVTVLLIVCPRSLLLCPFHKKT